MSVSQFTYEDEQLIAREYSTLRDVACRRCANAEEMQVVQKAFDFAKEAHKNIRRRSGEPYIIHPIAVAKIVVNDIGLGYKSIAAALLHDVVEDTEYTTDDIRILFGDKIASIVDGLTKIKTVLDNEEKNKEDILDYSESLQAENFKRILLTLNDDVRVVLIKLADRLHNCRTIEFMPEHKRDKILSETMYIFIPLAHRLGLYEVKSEMENIWLRYKVPDAYNEINIRINQNVSDKDREINKFIEPIAEALEKAGFDFEIRKRVKTPYSIWHKMTTKNVTFEQIYDLYAVRIIFNSELDSKESERDQCYHIFSIVTGLYRYKASRVRDWVKHPKSNGYEALHCTLMSNFGAWIEVQIRSRRMDDIAEKGIAAHWAYKKGGYITENESEMDKWLVKVKEILLQKDFNALELLDMIHNDLTNQNIVVFTPKGAQKSIMNGATALDFAYLIHSHIGHTAIAAKVNQKLSPLSYELKTGDQVEIITAESSAPKKEWLDFLHTNHAVKQVLEYLKSQNVDVSDYRKKIFEKYNVEKQGEVLSEGGNGQYVIANCCRPIPGDPIIGIRMEDDTIVVHKKSCHIAEEIATAHGDRLIATKWEDISGEDSFPVKITMRGIDRMGLVNEITQLISLNMGVNMTRINMGSDHGIFEGYIEMLVSDKTVLQRIIKKMTSIDGIQNVVRTDI